MATLAGITIFAIMAVVVVDVALRYLFNAPLAWAFDLISLYLMGAGFYFALGDTLSRNHHVNVDILSARFPPRLRSLATLIGFLLAIGFFGFVFRLAWNGAWSRHASGDVVAGAIPWPTWVPYAIACAGCGLILARLALAAIALAAAVATGNPRFGRLVADPPAGPGQGH